MSVSLNNSAESVEDKIFNMFLNNQGTSLNLASLLKAFEDHGITSDDPRLAEFYQNIQDLKNYELFGGKNLQDKFNLEGDDLKFKNSDSDETDSGITSNIASSFGKSIHGNSSYGNSSLTCKISPEKPKSVRKSPYSRNHPKTHLNGPKKASKLSINRENYERLEIEQEPEQKTHLSIDHKIYQITRKLFHLIIKDNIEIIARILFNQLVIPDFKSFSEDFHRISQLCEQNYKGRNADYIPQLKKYNPNYWGCSVCTIDGQRSSFGDSNVPFTMQSSSKPFYYAMALSQYGEEYVHKHVGLEPSGRSFKEMCLDRDNKPHNPMINAGAIMTVGILNPEMSIGDRFDKMFSCFKKAVGNKFLAFNNSVFLSERENSDRNFALAHFMRENDVYPEHLAKDKFKESLELYFMICSMEITCQSGAVLASTLANGGVCPLTGERVFKSDMVKHVLSLMSSCGMNDYSGQCIAWKNV